MPPNQIKPDSSALTPLSSSTSEKIFSGKSDKKEILCNGIVYDVTDWMKRHPGGDVIEVFVSNGEDAFHAIQQLHHRSIHKVDAIMKCLPHRQLRSDDYYSDSDSTTKSPGEIERHARLTKDFVQLYRQLQAEGLFDPDPWHIFLRISELFLFLVVTLSLLNWGSFPGSKILSTVVGALGIARSIWLMHEGSHKSLTGHVQADHYIHTFINGFLLGFSGSWWTQHHSRHHSMPQHEEHDTDLKTLPLIAFHSRLVKDKVVGQSFFIQNQKRLLIFIDTLLVALIWKLYLHPIHMLRHRKWFELVLWISHFFGIYCILGIEVGVPMQWLASMHAFGNISLSHTHLPVTQGQTHWVEYSLLHTGNVRSSRFVDWWMGYLNYQIEHHLFPAMPQFKNKLCQQRVQTFAKNHNLPYHEWTYVEAVQKTLGNLGKVSKQLMD